MLKAFLAKYVNEGERVMLSHFFSDPLRGFAAVVD